MKREYYSDSIAVFLNANPDEILGRMARENDFQLEQTQRDAWIKQISILQKALANREGKIYFEYSIPRMGKRIDVVLLIGPVIFVLEFKVGEKEFKAYDIDQVWDYALDLKNFHETSHERFIAPILLATEAKETITNIETTAQHDKILFPIKSNVALLDEVINKVLKFAEGSDIDEHQWEQGRYCPTPTIIEAAMALYKGHAVEDISRSDASAINLSETSAAVSGIIHTSKQKSIKSICFVTGVPGAGKTLVGLNIATKYNNETHSARSVFLSGNKPLVDVLSAALAKDKIQNAKQRQVKIKKGDALRAVKSFIQIIHHFEDEYLEDARPPVDHVALFDEAQRAWTMEKTTDFMKRKKSRPNFNRSEPEFLISCLDRHPDWAVVVCLVGGGQEIHTGEAGISEWIDSLNRSFPNWHIHISARLSDSEYGAGRVLETIKTRPNVFTNDKLHLAVSMRSFRAESVSLLVKQLLDIKVDEARKTLTEINKNYPIVLTRDLCRAKQWLREHARGSERYGIVVSSAAERLKPHAIDVKSPMDPVHWFLDGKEDVRSSYYLEDVATEFSIQGLELDWACVTWDGDFRFTNQGWEHWSFCGSKWRHVGRWPPGRAVPGSTVAPSVGERYRREVRACP